MGCCYYCDRKDCYPDKKYQERKEKDRVYRQRYSYDYRHVPGNVHHASYLQNKD